MVLQSPDSDIPASYLHTNLAHLFQHEPLVVSKHRSLEQSPRWLQNALGHRKQVTSAVWNGRMDYSDYYLGVIWTTLNPKP